VGSASCKRLPTTLSDKNGIFQPYSKAKLPSYLWCLLGSHIDTLEERWSVGDQELLYTTGGRLTGSLLLTTPSFNFSLLAPFK
jgi:hypothetical protein